MIIIIDILIIIIIIIMILNNDSHNDNYNDNDNNFRYPCHTSKKVLRRGTLNERRAVFKTRTGRTTRRHTPPHHLATVQP